MSKRNRQNVKAEERPLSDQGIDVEVEESTGRRGLSRPAFILLSLLALAFIAYSVVSLIGIHSQIREKRQELDDIMSEIKVQEIKNEDIKRLYDSTGSDFSTLAEQIARDDLDYVKEGERVFVNISGD